MKPGEPMSTATPDELVAVSRARNLPDPLQPLQFWGLVWAVPLLAVPLTVWLGFHEPLTRLADVSRDSLVALSLALLLILGGEVLPMFGRRFKDPTGVSWATPFAFAVLIAFDALSAVLLLVVATIVSGLIDRQGLFRLAFNAGQYTLSLLAAQAVLSAFGVRASLAEPWYPHSVGEAAVCLLAGAAYFVVNETLVSAALAALRGDSLFTELRQTLKFEISVNGAQLALGPLVATLMVVSPVLTLLAVIPVIAIHLSAAGSMATAWAASHDDLTGLANRAEFNAVTSRALRQHQERERQDTKLALLLLDLDGFKEVNDILGHPTGDRVLKEVADRLLATIPQAQVIARPGGDEFTILLEVSGAAEAMEAGERIGESLRQPYMHENGQLVDIDASIGIAVYPDHGADLATLFSRADVAMYAAKRESAGCLVFDPASPVHSISRLGILGSLRRALDEGELYLDYQPKIDLKDRALVGVEALVRWRHPSGVLIPPDEFIPAAEQSGLMPRLTDAVLEMALTQGSAWRRSGLEVPVAVNVSLRDLLEPGFVAGVAAKLKRHRMPARNLTLEVTERVLANDLASARRSMVQLNKLGVGLSMDDFGTGWSSLLMLRTLPVTEVKLDRSFVTRAVDSEMDQAIVAKVAELCHALGLTVVAEGVETLSVLDKLASLGCDEAQGWHVARPMAGDAMVAWSNELKNSTTPMRAEDMLPSQGGMRGIAAHAPDIVVLPT